MSVDHQVSMNVVAAFEVATYFAAGAFVAAIILVLFAAGK